jgi:hypothetical protein
MQLKCVQEKIIQVLCRKSANCKRIWPGNWLLLPPSTAFDFAKAGNKTLRHVYTNKLENINVFVLLSCKNKNKSELYYKKRC